MIDRINEAIEAAIAEANDNGATHDYTGEVVASISDGRIVITNNSLRDIDITEKDSTGTTAEQLGILKDTSGSITGDRILAGLNTTLLSSINGGAGCPATATSASPPATARTSSWMFPAPRPSRS